MNKFVTTGMALSLILAAHTCKRIRESADSTGERQNSKPVIEIMPLEQGGGLWKISTTDAVVVTVTAPGAQRVQILGRNGSFTLCARINQAYSIGLRSNIRGERPPLRRATRAIDKNVGKVEGGKVAASDVP